MTLPSRFSLLNSEFNGFLYSAIGNEGNEMPLSVLSAMTRLGLDPWVEAARLATLPKAVASHALAAMIARLPIGLSAVSDADSNAARLVELLPRGQTSTTRDGGPASSGFRPPVWFYAAVSAAALAVVWLAARLWLR